MRHTSSLVPPRSGPWKHWKYLRSPCLTCAIIPRRPASTRAPSIRLDLPAIDQKWQKRWDKRSGTQAVPQRPEKAYVLSMFPYPSGALHIGHLRVYAITDVLARFKHMQGYEVLHPMGWDAFGLPAENAAIERGIDPAEWTVQNIAKMKAQLKAMNGSMDWSREFMTCDPEYYKHTQRVFLLLHEHGLAYQAKSLVNFDPIDRTVLANEQVDSNGCSWRSGAKVEQINLKQWFLKITAFKEALLKDLEFLREDGKWPDRVLAMQKHWLGHSEGAKLRFPIDVAIDAEPGRGSLEQPVEVYTTRPDTLFGVQYLALSASHPLVKRYRAHDPALTTFIESLPTLPPDSKAGFQLSGVTARNPLSSLPGASDSLHEALPVFVAPYVIEGYGAGAVMGVPGHDARDHAFWKHNRPTGPVLYVVQPANHTGPDKADGISTETFAAPGILTSQSGSFQGLTSREASARIISELEHNGGSASKAETWRLRDWLISRQRYWGTPIPIIHCGECGAVPVPTEDLPVKLPKIEGSFQHRTGNPLESAHDWVNVRCPSCGGPAKRDTDTMDTFACSSWYMFRFIDPNNKEQPFSPEKANSMMPVDIYVGGVEHAILHLLYARFISKFLATTTLWPSGSSSSIRGEPFRTLISQGMVHGKTYSDPQTGRFLKPDEVDLSDPSKPTLIKTGELAAVSFEKMSKSKHNGVDPNVFISKYGADVTRAHMLFLAPVSEVMEWDESRIVGIQRWFQRIWRLVEQWIPDPDSSATSTGLNPSFEPNTKHFSPGDRKLHLALEETVSSVNTALSRTHALNTCISDLMQLTNTLASASTASVALHHYTLSKLLRLLAPFAPAFSAECWERLHDHLSPLSSHPLGDIFSQSYPKPLPAEKLKVETQTCAVMENGKLRAAVEIGLPPDGLKGNELEEWVLSQVRSTEVGEKWLRDREGKEWKRVVVVKGGKTVNFVG